MELNLTNILTLAIALVVAPVVIYKLGLFVWVMFTEFYKKDK